MTAEIHWPAIALRLLLTVIAGGILGAERSKTGHPAGLRTTLLVTLAASVAMIQVNLLMPTNGKPHDSYAVMDLMRLPLGILTGVGFIGAGAIVRKNEIVLGITTAATLWFATVVGLCLGGGQLVLGSAATLTGFLVLQGLRGVENRIERYERATLCVMAGEDWLTVEELRDRLVAAKFHVRSLSVSHFVDEHRKSISCELRWPSTRGAADIPPILAELESLPGLIELEWKGMGSSPN
ncbi:MgtC/SapB family protein [Paracidobacterium acidisoli]|uniref:MgtC/SapB family protein n=1 Tax=Paracidobacterium acidisoli TaxID=2303751 RepID=A0A372ILC8_9BACT|nr:MgtC/SapB family protein [Paracidobacterium acidisoli]MBT9332286.1 MgtC/SapB family protein [Paracidobacterium acidisoli]